RGEAALLKFRQKRKERCFDKKIRYINRKKLAERRPRVKGQFVRKVNGIDVDLNGQPTGTEFDDEDEEEEED
ncbi:CCT domain-containing protein, partial [Nitriliruptoraceae bacterium ZYF776]|nr:CCT domain-containing protein [Profundirhabdus halotolerans]